MSITVPSGRDERMIAFLWVMLITHTTAWIACIALWSFHLLPPVLTDQITNSLSWEAAVATFATLLLQAYTNRNVKNQGESS